MRRKIVAGNWKMNKTPTEAKALASEISAALGAAPCPVEVVVCPPAIDLPAVTETLRGTQIGVGAQNMHNEPKGAFTGEISIPMLKEVGVSWVILGHSERREYNGETSEKCNEKIKALLANDMTPVYCCGESLATYESGKTKAFVEEQIKVGFAGLSPEEAKKVVIAYEPIWAIGTGKSATKETAEDTIAFIRGVLKGLFGAVSEEIRILYGGSVKPENIAAYMSEKDIDGALVGGASLEPTSFKALIENLAA
jgi:triosephosphate isomerase